MKITRLFFGQGVKVEVGMERVRVLSVRLHDACEGYSGAEIVVALGLIKLFYEDKGFKWLDEAELRDVFRRLTKNQ